MSTIQVCGGQPKKRQLGRVYFKDGGIKCTFDYTGHLDALIGSWCRRYPQLGHIDMDRVILTVAKCRSTSRRGIYASVTSLRFPEGTQSGANGKRKHMYRWPKVRKNGRQALYLIKFYLPRFHNLSLEEKVATILHELYHIHPKFNGEFRTFSGRHWAHGNSRGKFEKMYESLKRDILKRSSPLREMFLNCRFHTLLKRYGNIYGDRLTLSPVGRKLASIS